VSFCFLEAQGSWKSMCRNTQETTQTKKLSLQGVACRYADRRTTMAMPCQAMSSGVDGECMVIGQADRLDCSVAAVSPYVASTPRTKPAAPPPSPTCSSSVSLAQLPCFSLAQEPSGLRQTFHIAETHLAASVVKLVSVEDLHTEIALLKPTWQSVWAPAMASDMDAEEVRMQNRELLKTVKELREENASLLQSQEELEQAVEEVQAEARVYVTHLLSDIENLRMQLSKLHLRCNNAEEQRDVQKQLFLKLFMNAKHDMEQSNTQHAKAVKHAMLEDYLRIAAKRTASPLDNRNEAAPIHCTEDTFKNKLAHAQGTQTPKSVFAEHNLALPASRLDGNADEVSLPHLSPVSPVHKPNKTSTNH